MGTRTPRSSVRTTRLMLRGFALVYLVAFVSLGLQVRGLFGSRGILPAGPWLAWLASRAGDGAWLEHPTLFWLGSSDFALSAACWTGAAAALALAAGFVPTLAAATCWVLYLSLFQVGRVFLGFQWDTLLLEAGFLAVFLAPLRWRQHPDYDPEPSPVVVWMLRWLLFRLMFASGVVKLVSGDPSWWDLSALGYHYWTQPLPTWTAWAAHQLPAPVHAACVLAMFVVELGIPWLALGPRRARLAAFPFLAGLQVLIAATGNYGFFNLLTGVLCLSLLDDDALGAAARLGRRRDGTFVAAWPGEKPRLAAPVVARRVALAALALPLAVAGGAAMVARTIGPQVVPPPLQRLVEVLEPWRVTSAYGLFAAMTKTRREVVLEGTEDGVTWREYPMRWKPGDLEAAPLFVAPHQPRLDWQMWFAALGDARRSPWLGELQQRLLEASPDVLGLFAADPFDGRRPLRVRALLYDYEFTTWPELEETGAWWKRRLVGPFSPPLPR